MERILTPAQSELVEKNHGLIYKFMKEYGLLDDDWYGILAIELCETALAWEPEKKPFKAAAFAKMQKAVDRQLLNASKMDFETGMIRLNAVSSDGETEVGDLIGVDDKNLDEVEHAFNLREGMTLLCRLEMKASKVRRLKFPKKQRRKSETEKKIA